MNKQFLALLLALALLCAAGCACAEDRLLLPADTRTIQAQAFYRTAELDTAVLPEGLETIGAKAFAESSLTGVNLPASLTSIAADAFDGCTGLQMTVIAGTPGEAYAIAQGIDHTVLPAEPVDTGVYTFINQAASSYLAWRDNELYLSPTPQQWTLCKVDEQGFNVYAGDTELLLDIDNANVEAGNPVKLWENTGYDVQIWRLSQNTNGTYSFLYSGDESYCLGFEGGNAVLQIRKSGKASQEWRMGCAAVKWPYLSVMGQNRIVELRLPTDILSVIGESRLKQWANDLETAYASFYELTGFRPYDDIVVEAYKPSEYIGWVVDGSNIIHIDRDFLVDDLGKMAARTGDWNFCALHEMGHMFDMERPWNFEAEVMTDLKVAYVLESNDAAAAPSEFGAEDCFRGADIIDAFRILGADFSEEYSVYGLAARFLEIKDHIGWEPFMETFHYMQANADDYADTTGSEKLESFIELLSRYSKQTVISCFSDAEWNTMLGACN